MMDKVEKTFVAVVVAVVVIGAVSVAAIALKGDDQKTGGDTVPEWLSDLDAYGGHVYTLSGGDTTVSYIDEVWVSGNALHVAYHNSTSPDERNGRYSFIPLDSIDHVYLFGMLD